MATVPDIVDSAEADAITAILTANLVPGSVAWDSHDDSVVVGNVLRQIPDAGLSVADGTAVHYTVRKEIPWYFKEKFWREPHRRKDKRKRR